MSEERAKPRGGNRPGAGRKPTGAKLHSFRLTDEHYELVKAYVKTLKAKKKPPAEGT